MNGEEMLELLYIVHVMRCVSPLRQMDMDCERYQATERWVGRLGFK